MTTFATRLRRRTLRRSVAGVVGLLCGAVALSGCKFDGAYDLPLPGHPVDKDHSYEVTAEFRDILNVVPRSPVKVNDVTVGEVTDVRRVGWHASIKMRIRDDVKLPDNAIADIRQVSLLGEKYVAVEAPTDRTPVGRLSDGDDIPMSSTGRNPEVEEVLGALSFLLSGGGVGQIKTISVELNKVMSGRQDRLRHLLGQLDSFVGTLDDQKQDIVRALDSINNLSATLNREKRTLTAALDNLGPAIDVLRSQHAKLMTMLHQLDRLGRVGTRVIGSTKDDLLADLAHLRPVLHKLNEAGDSLPQGLSLMISFPFPAGTTVVKGDYANTSIAMDVNLANLMKFYGVPNQSLPLPDLSGIPGLPEIPGLKGNLKLPGNKSPKLPKSRLPKLGGNGGGGSGGGGNGGGGLPSLPGLGLGASYTGGTVGTGGGFFGEGL
jgi:phospholipid/cholesterol/gamma-HCH transport system substrate-binding protein